MASTQLAFVIEDQDPGVPQSQRQLIRRHCMKGKNKKADSRRSRREARRAATASAEADAVSVKPHPQRVDNVSVSTTGKSHPQVEGVRRRSHLTKDLRFQAGRDSIQTSIASDWALFPFVVEIDTRSQRFLHKYLRQNPVRDPMLPFRSFGIQVDLGFDPLWCPRLLASDELMLQAMLLLVYASEDLVVRRLLSNSTRHQLQHLLPLLNRRLSGPSDYQQDMILYVVSILASVAVSFGDYASAEAHAAGISNILQLRGGLTSITRNPGMQLAIDRLNFSSMLMTERWRVVHSSSAWAAPVWPQEVRCMYEHESMISEDFIPDEELAKVFQTIQHTAIMLRLHASLGIAVNGALLRDAMGYSQAVLACRMQADECTDPISECIGIGMTTFVAATFRLPDLYEHPCHRISTRRLISYLEKSRHLLETLPTEVQVWLVLVRSMSAHVPGNVTGSLELWERSVLGRSSWIDLRHQARRVMWFDAMHDNLGRSAFDRVHADAAAI